MRSIVTALFALALSGAFGCGYFGPTELEQHWGDAHRDNKAQMIANPAAGELHRDPVEGLDPKTGENVMGKHRRAESGSGTGQSDPSIVNINTSPVSR